MPVEIKQILNGGMDLDTNYAMLPKNRYGRALNITHDAFAESHDEILTNIISNKKVPYNYPAGTGRTIGAFPFSLRGTVIFFRYNSNSLHGVYEYSMATGLISKIFECFTDSNTDILNFTIDGKITGVNIFPRDNNEGDLLLFLDSLKRPTQIDIALFKAGAYNPVTRDIIDVAKRPPLSPPTGIIGNDTTRQSNGFRNLLTRYKYRYIYDDLTKSTCSPISAIVLPKNILDNTYTNLVTNNNVVYLSMNSGEKDVKSVELLVSICNKTNSWSDFSLIQAINKDDINFAISVIVTQRNVASTRLISETFTGTVIAGTQVTIKIRRLSDGFIITVADYTAINGDTISNIVTQLISDLNASPFVVSASTDGIGLKYYIDRSLYAYSDTVIVNAIPPNTDNIIFSYPFFNDGTYAPIDLRESILLFDLVPPYANAQELANGNVLIYGGIREGYNRDLIPNVVNTILTIAAGGGGNTGDLNVVVQGPISNGSGTSVGIFKFTGSPATATTVVLTMKRISDSVNVTATYTTLAGDTSVNVAQGESAIINSTYGGSVAATTNFGGSGPSGIYLSFLEADYAYVGIEINAPLISATANSIPTFSFFSHKKIALGYFDKKGRTNGILYDASLTFPAYAENGTQQVLLPYVNMKIYHTPPIWAHSYQVYFTKDGTTSKYWQSINVLSDTDYLYFDVTNFDINSEKNPTVGAVCNYEFKDGDRMRLIKRKSDNTVFGYTYDATIEGLVPDPKINGNITVGNYIKIRKISPFNSVDYSSKYFVIDLYTPGVQAAGGDSENEVFYECAQQYPILNPTTDLREHGGQVTDQNIANGIPAEINIYNGDVYFRLRSAYISDTGLSEFNVLDSNFVDIYTSAVNDIDGRASEIDVNAKDAYYSTLIRFGQAYQPNTNINGLNRFYEDNFDEYNSAFGDIQIFKARDTLIHCFFKLKVGKIPLYNQIVKDANGRDVLTVSDKLINPIHYYSGNFGIGDNTESLASHNFADYFSTNIEGSFCRLSEDGIDVISVLYKINSFATEQLPLRTGSYKVYGAFDQRLSNYIVALEATDTQPAYTLVFDEKTKTWETFWSLPAEMMCCLDTLFISFKNGELYTHNGNTYNEFFGVKYPSAISLVFNEHNPVRKKFLTIGYQSKKNKKWVVPYITTNTVNPQTNIIQESSLIDRDFSLEETTITGALLRDKNSMNDPRIALMEGDYLGGNYIIINLEISVQDASDLVSLVQPYLTYEISNRNF